MLTILCVQKGASRDTNIGHSLCSNKCFEGHKDLRFLMLVCKALKLPFWGWQASLCWPRYRVFLVSLSKVLEGFSRRTSRLSLRAVLRTGAAPTKKYIHPHP